jgi:2-polyprenyl-3-methyl-5-hydroxy-6-metoxy-1,4-benzoquinol methylase
MAPAAHPQGSHVKVLLVPSIRAFMGSGHLRRSLRLAQIFGPDSAVLLEGLDDALGSGPQRQGPASRHYGSGPQHPGSAVEALLAPLGLDSSACRFLERYDPAEPWDLVILDRRSSAVDQISRFFPAPVVGLDEGGPARRYCSYLIDIFPTYRQRHSANLAALSLMDLPACPSMGRRAVSRSTQPQRSQPQRPERQPAERRPAERHSVERKPLVRIPPDNVLISFGGEDPADLSSLLLELLLRGRFFERRQITVVQGPYFKRRCWPEGITVLRNADDLKSMLGAYDLLFCSFGLTTYEALAAGVPVINLNPSAYHYRLSSAAGIPQIGVRRPASRKLERLLADPRVFQELLSRYPPETFFQSPQLSELPDRLRPSGPARCPICGQTNNPALARFERRSYFACRDCGMIYLIGFGQTNVHYDEGYFFSRYQKQYGKTYLEDFQSIKRAAAARLTRIRRIAPAVSSSAPSAALPSAAPTPPDLRLLDVGCAYGPFLQAAAEGGFRAHGLDVAREAVRYVRDQLGIPCGLGDFTADAGLREIEGAELGFDVITMWYVIEHFRDAGAVLRRINSLLRREGVFAFATPNAAGISGRKNRIRFLKNSPQDHYTVWSPRRTAGILKRYGFRLRNVVVTGHHGERFPWPGRLAPESTLSSGFSALSRLLRLGDTFEAYAVKVRDPA